MLKYPIDPSRTTSFQHSSPVSATYAGPTRAARILPMFKADEDRVLAGMVRERRELLRQIARLEELLEKTVANLYSARVWVENVTIRENFETSDYRVDYMPADELSERIRSLRDLKERLAEINTRLDVG